MSHATIRMRVGVTAALVGCLSLFVACSPTDESAGASCVAAVDAAAAAIEPRDELRLLDDAIVICGSYEEYATQLSRHPGLLGYSVAGYIDRRCDVATNTDVTGSPTCLTVNPPTTPPVSTTPDIVFVGTTLDGRLIEMRPSAEIPFDASVPSEIERTVQIAFADGCEGLRVQRDQWAALADSTPQGDVASVYAQHAQNVATYTGCDIGTAVVPATGQPTNASEPDPSGTSLP